MDKNCSRTNPSWENNIENITFTNEKYLLLDGPDGCRKYWQMEGEEKSWFEKKFLAGELLFGQALHHEEQQQYIL